MMAVIKMPTGSVSSELSIPFPKPGLYRIFLQFKRAVRIETTSFDARVQAAESYLWRYLSESPKSLPQRPHLQMCAVADLSRDPYRHGRWRA
jgi:hypothetical protein